MIPSPVATTDAAPAAPDDGPPPAPLDVYPGVPLLTPGDVDRLQAGLDRCTVAIVLLAAVIMLIQLGRYIGVGA